ncbi:MAG: hypothetical protein LUH45_00075 [Clostridiales bacterium]|nr:hypothetical protein [Clostridiales bacterium]
MRDKLFVKRLIMSLVGVCICGVAVGFFNTAVFGVDPFQCFAQGLHNQFQFIPVFASYGTFYAAVNLVLLVIDLFLDRHYIGLATFLNMFFVGYLVTFSQWCIYQVVPEPGFATRVVLLIIGIFLCCLASALYYTADLGVSTYDAIPLFITDRKPKIAGKVIPFRFIRIVSDLICVVIGYFCGAVVGIGTVITAFFMGPLIEVLKKAIAIPLLYGKQTADSTAS